MQSRKFLNEDIMNDFKFNCKSFFEREYFLYRAMDLEFDMIKFTTNRK